MSPVCRRKSCEPGSALILSIASFRVPATSWFAALLKPMWLSLICTKLNSDAALWLRRFSGGGEESGRGYAADHRPHEACACPGHAAEKAPTIDSVVAGVSGFRRLGCFELLLCACILHG